ncbi:MAG: tripartite tricarboxylate transporter substrate binding protein [Rhodoferax sp.]|nr:tripartite tricarboxylate transporter substrate binding protein [Rhodoferax sp.]
MSTRRFSLLQSAVFAVFLMLGSYPAWAQTDYPSKPVKVVVAFPPGGTSDVMARMLADELSKSLKQPFVVENIGGAGGTIGIERALKLPADGYTLIQTGVGQSAVAHGLDPNLRYNSMSDFIHLSQVHSGPNVLVVHPATPYKTVADVVDFAKKNPGKLDYGFTHAASGHMAMELFKQTAGIELTGIPYKGGGPMLIDLLAGVIPTMFINQDAALAHVRAGKMRAIAVSSVARNPLYPDVPTIAESGYKGFEALSWSGMSVAKGTPQAVVDKLEAAISQAMQSDTIRQRMTSVGFVVPPQGSKHYTTFVKSELDTWVRVIKTAGIKPE